MIRRLLSVTVLGLAAASSIDQSIWHAFDGIPILLSKQSSRKLGTKTNNNVSSLNSSPTQNQHRALTFGDYADTSFSCPALTTCPIVCTADVNDCPTTCASVNPDSDHEFEACADGTCADLTLGESCAVELESVCTCAGMEVTCPKIVDYYDDCFESYQEYYDLNAECVAEEEENLPQVDFNGVVFRVCYATLIAVTVGMFGWCAWNQRLSPVTGSSVELMAVKMDGNHNGGKWIQTGYRRSLVGSVLNGLIVLVILAFQGLLLFLTIEYYVQQEAGPALENLNMIFHDEIQVLMAFEIVWMTGFVWCFLLKWPASIQSMCLRRCLPSSAGFIAVSAPVRAVDTSYEKKCIVNFIWFLMDGFYTFMDTIFSIKSECVETGLRYKTEFCKVRTDKKTGSRYFYFRMRRYIYDESTNRFIPGRLDITEGASIGDWLDKDTMHKGLTGNEATQRLGVVGPNILDLKKPTVLGCIIREFSKPFYLYQNFMVWTWAPYWYYYMAIVQTVVRVTGGLVVAVFQYMADMDLYRLMVVDGTVQVVRDGALVTLNQTDVVPGDVVKVTPGIAYFDMAILQSQRLLVDESALTGEVHPVAKLALDPSNQESSYSQKAFKSSTISAGTTVLECADGEGLDGVLAICTETGSFTAKGELLSDVLSYERHQFKFDTEVKLVLFILLVEMAVLVSVVLHVIEDHWVYAWFYAMFVAGTCLPPLLPTVFVVSVGISCKRLQAKRITCTDSTAILVAGKVKRAFFDKTGTLTEQGLRFVSARKAGDLGKSTTDNDNSTVEDPDLQLGLSVCHTLTSNGNGDLIGPAVDRMAFSAVHASSLLNEHSIRFGDETIQYLKRFEFDHHTMTQSVIIERNGEKIVFVKGSPEAIGKLCVPSSLPSDFADHARYAARNGVYQLAMGKATYTGDKDMSEVQRSDIEKNLEFLCCVNFQNTMKYDTPGVVSELKEGRVESAIVTGDNVLTGIYIAKKAGIIENDKHVVLGAAVIDDSIQWVDASDDSEVGDPSVSFPDDSVLAMTGEVWNHLIQYDPKAALTLAKKTLVFGRLTPNDKVSIVSTFVENGDITLMCGDGGNDCGALKAAHLGIALSDAEASVVAPFTSLDKTITSVTEVLREGRCALASAFASYKYMIMYGQVESINQVVNAYFSITFSEWCWVFMDGIWPITMAFSLPLSKAAAKLSPKRPTASILGPHTLSSACGVLAINFLFLACGLALLFSQDWYQCRKWDSNDVSNVNTIGDNYETSVIFIITGYQYISSAAAYNFGYTYRASWIKNYVFVFFFTVWTAFQFIATLTVTKFSCIWRLNCTNDNVTRFVVYPDPQPIFNNFNTTLMPTSFRGMLVALMVANLILVCAWDYFVVNRMLPCFKKHVAGEMQKEKKSMELPNRSYTNQSTAKESLLGTTAVDESC